MAKITVRHVAALFAGLSLLAAACGSDEGSTVCLRGACTRQRPVAAPPVRSPA